jgi:rhodanese-related sulfurtransferase
MSTTAAGTAIDVIDYDDFVARQTDPTVAVVDVLPATTYRHSHIPGAVNLPLAHVLDFAAEQLPDKDQEIILYCASFT